MMTVLPRIRPRDFPGESKYIVRNVDARILPDGARSAFPPDAKRRYAEEHNDVDTEYTSPCLAKIPRTTKEDGGEVRGSSVSASYF